MITEYFAIGVSSDKKTFGCKNSFVAFCNMEHSIFPQFLTIAQVDKIKLLPVVIFECSEISNFADSKIIRTIAGATMLVTQNYYASIFRIELQMFQFLAFRFF